MTIGQRLKQLRGKASQAHIAEMLKLPQTTWSNYENDRNKPDFALIDTICSTFSVNTDWLLFGRGPMRPAEAAPATPDSTLASQAVPQPMPQPVPQLMPQSMPDSSPAVPPQACSRCAKLDAELEAERRERRELTAEVRNLWKENGELREKCARLEERQYQRSGSVDSEHVGHAG